MEFVSNDMWQKVSFPHAFCRVGKKLYFSTLLNNLLLELDLESGEIESYFFPKSEKRAPSYREAIAYDGSLIFIPLYENFFAFFNNGKIYTVDSIGSYASIRLWQDKLFLLDRGRSCVDIFDLRNHSYLDSFFLPQNNDAPERYIDIAIENDCVYVSCAVGKHMLQMDIASKKMEWIHTDEIICHGALVDGKWYYTSAVTDMDGIYCFDLQKRKSARVAQISYATKGNIQYFRFWKACKIEDYIFFLPHEADQIIKYHIQTNQTEYITPFSEKHHTLRPDGSNAVYGIIPYEDRLIVMPYYGDSISIIDYSGCIIKSYCFPIPKEYLITDALNNGNLYESVCSLEDYVEFIVSAMGRQHQISILDNDIGRLVYKKTVYAKK